MISDDSLTPTPHLLALHLFDAAHTSKWNEEVNV